MSRSRGAGSGVAGFALLEVLISVSILSVGILVVEGAEYSGSAITAASSYP